MPTGPDLPSTAMLMRIAADHGLDLTTADADSYRSLMAGAIESYRRLEAFSEPKPPLSVPATAAGGRGPRTTRSTVGTGAATSRARRAACTGSRSGWTAHPPTSEHSRIGSPGARWPTLSAPRSPPRLRKARCGHGKPRRPSLRASDHSRACASDRCTHDLGRLFLGFVSGPDSNTHGFGVRDLVWGWHSADLRRSTRAGTSERSGARTQAAPYHSRLLRWCGCFSTDVNDI
jgi:hypothetical protein